MLYQICNIDVHVSGRRILRHLSWLAPHRQIARRDGQASRSSRLWAHEITITAANESKLYYASESVEDNVVEQTVMAARWDSRSEERSRKHRGFRTPQDFRESWCLKFDLHLVLEIEVIIPSSPCIADPHCLTACSTYNIRKSDDRLNHLQIFSRKRHSLRNLPRLGVPPKLSANFKRQVETEEDGNYSRRGSNSKCNIY